MSVTAHYGKWAELGMNLGYMHEAKILAEAGGGTGSIDYTYASFTVEQGIRRALARRTTVASASPRLPSAGAFRSMAARTHVILPLPLQRCSSRG
jgi:hypothetical protein